MSLYPDSVQFLYALGNEFKTIKFGLERISALLDALGQPQHSARVIHVAGTNGKGSTCAFLERTLRQAGVHTGLYTSPHLVEPTERIRIDGQPVSPDEFAAAFQEVHLTAERLIATGAIDMHPTYFETVTAMAFLLFRARGCETVVLETGMGGRLDATNTVNPALSVITAIDIDHERFLGHTIPEIAAEKAGILKPGRPAVIARQHTEALHVLERRAAALQAPLVSAAAWRIEHLQLHAAGSRFNVHGPSGQQLDIQCPLIGAHQVENALTAIAALSHLGYSASQIEAGIGATQWPGRLELIRRSPDVFLDGAHNPAGARALAGYIRHFHHQRRVWMLFAAMRDKDLSLIGPTLFPLAAELIFTTPNQARAFRAEEIRQLSGEARAHVTDTVPEALALLRNASPADAIFITGSLYLVGEARALLVG